MAKNLPAKALRLFRRGLRQTAIGERLNRHQGTVSRALRAAGVPRLRRRVVPCYDLTSLYGT